MLTVFIIWLFGALITFLPHMWSFTRVCFRFVFRKLVEGDVLNKGIFFSLNPMEFEVRGGERYLNGLPIWEGVKERAKQIGLLSAIWFLWTPVFAVLCLVSLDEKKKPKTPPA